MKQTIVFTGGGTAGHVTPNLALIDALASEFHCVYIGSKKGVEQQIVAAKHIPYYAVRSGKLRRYWSWKNFKDPFNLLIGIIQSIVLLRKLRPRLVFSKGGFVALPVVIAAWFCRVPVIAHESDLTPGLANRLSFPFVNQVCVTFDAGKAYFKQQHKVQVTGTPIRPELFHGNRELGLKKAGFSGNKPCLLVMGGSLGSGILNQSVRAELDTLLETFDVLHLCGKNNVDATLAEKAGYYQLEYATDDLPDLFAAADVMLSRAGANAVYEVLALAKPHVFVPLSRRYSRGDQVDNARHFEKAGVSLVLDETSLTPKDICAALLKVYTEREVLVKRIKALNVQSATPALTQLIREACKA